MKSTYTNDYQRLLKMLVDARRRSGVTQQELAKRLGRPQSFVSKVEHGERRIDVIEFIEICRAIGTEPAVLVRRIERT